LRRPPRPPVRPPCAPPPPARAGRDSAPPGPADDDWGAGLDPRAPINVFGRIRMEGSKPEPVAEFDGWLAHLMASEGSALHVKVGSAPLVRMPDGLIRLERDALTPMETSAIAESIIPEERMHRFNENGEVDFAYSLKDVGR